jgi:phage repressor protein C with HTH and peptisase S24 domain
VGLDFLYDSEMDNVQQLIADWVQASRKAAELSQEALGIKLAFELGSERGNTKANISHWENKRHSPNLHQLMAIAKITGKALPDQITAAMGFTHGPVASSLTDEELQRLLPGAKRVRAVDDDDPALTHIPKVKLRLSAGITGFEVEPERFDGSTTTIPTDWMERKGFRRDKLIAISVKGESMEPSLYEDDLVVVNTADTNPVDGAVYAVNYEGDSVVKRLTRDAGQWWLTSDNPDQRRYYRRVCNGPDCIIIGRVVRKESERL